MRKFQLFFIVIVTLLACIFFFQKTSDERTAKETITYFPLDPNVEFLDKKTVLSSPNQVNDGYELQLNSMSRLNKSAYLRHDISFLFANGKLVGKIGKWAENTDIIEDQLKMSLNHNELLRAITFHHAEIHSNSDQITSSQTMSEDDLYVIQTNLPSLISFKSPSTEEEIGWKEVLDKKEDEAIRLAIQNAEENFGIDLDFYHIIPLTDLPNYEKKGLPSFSKEQSKQIIGRLMEGLYKNYFLGIKTNNGKIISPINSTIPIILLAKNREHLMIIIQTQTGETIRLIQNIPRVN